MYSTTRGGRPGRASTGAERGGEELDPDDEFLADTMNVEMVGVTITQLVG